MEKCSKMKFARKFAIKLAQGVENGTKTAVTTITVVLLGLRSAQVSRVGAQDGYIYAWLVILLLLLNLLYKLLR